MNRIGTLFIFSGTILFLFVTMSCRSMEESAPAATPVSGASRDAAELPERGAIEASIRRLVTYDGCSDLTTDLRLTATDAAGKREQIDLRVQRRFDDTASQTFLRVLAPADEIDKAILAIQRKDQPTEAFSWLPGLKKLAKLSSGRSLGFHGARVTVQELLGLELGQYTWQVEGLSKEATGESLVKVAFAERPDFGLAFPKITGYFDRSSLLPVRFELLSASGEILKRIVVGKIESIESRQTLTRLTIEDISQKLLLTLDTSKVDYDRGLKLEEFTEDRLKRTVSAAAGRVDGAKGH
jgi:hypothetical protein